MSTKPNSSEGWVACPPGSLEEFAGRERTRQRRRFLMKASGVTVALGLGGVAGIKALAPPLLREPRFDGVTCAEFRDQYHELLAETLSPQLMGLMRGHVARCETCQEFVRTLQSQANG